MTTCIFCKILNGEIPSTKVYEDEHTYAFLDAFPVAPHHTLVIPKKHYENMFDVPEQELAHIIKTVKQIVESYKTEFGMKHVNILNNSGAEAQQTVFHLHFHIIPRGLK